MICYQYLVNLTIVNAHLVYAPIHRIDKRDKSLQALTLNTCDIDTKWLYHLTEEARALTSVRVVETRGIWIPIWQTTRYGRWVSFRLLDWIRIETLQNGFWKLPSHPNIDLLACVFQIDVLHTLRSHSESLKEVELTTGYLHNAPFIFQEKLDFGSYPSLERLTTDQESTVIVSESIDHRTATRSSQKT